MTTRNKGLLAAVLIMVPILWAVADTVFKLSESGAALMPVLVGVFLVVNLFCALLCVEERTAEKVFLLFMRYVLITFFTTILLVVLILVIAIKTGAIQFGKIGG